jgi:RNA polymerase sigma factor (sigma-70 family)
MKEALSEKEEIHSSHTDHSDNETLLLRIREGDVSAFDQLYNRYYLPVVGFIRKYVDESDIEDIAQDVFIRIYRKMDGIHTLKAFECYLFRTAKHCSINWLKKKMRIRNLARIIMESSSTWMDEKTPHQNEELDSYTTLISQLPEQTRQIIKWFYFEKISREEIAKKMNVSKSTAYRRIAESRAELLTAAESEKIAISFAGRHDFTIHSLLDVTENER